MVAFKRQWGVDAFAVWPSVDTEWKRETLAVSAQLRSLKICNRLNSYRNFEIERWADTNASTRIGGAVVLGMGPKRCKTMNFDNAQAFLLKVAAEHP